MYVPCRDRLTADDCIGTAYLPISAISGQGDDGIVTDLLFFTFCDNEYNFVLVENAVPWNSIRTS